ncbi:MAG: alpha/beta hydrolase fold domain-containing protein [Saprospiraceae bacterium]|nr:alpha/beta hydrolase fold domain-containing protein [Saprospiraceae bacterium]
MKILNLSLFLCFYYVVSFAQLNVQFDSIPSSIITTTSSNPVYALNLPYGTDDTTLQSFHIFLPDTIGTFPLAIYIHGGGFTGGTKNKIYTSNSGKQELTYFLDNGIACASIDYRLLPNSNSPLLGTDTDGVIKCLNDAKRALQYIRYYADDLHIDPEKVVVYGGSAGAGTSLWLATRANMADPTANDPVLRMSTEVCAAVALNTQSTYDLYRWETDVFDDFDGNGTNFTMDSIEALLGFDRYNDFYGGIVDSTYDILVDPVLIQYRQDVDVFYHLDANDPPLYIQSLNSATHPAQDPLHHHLHSKTLYDTVVAVGLSEVKADITAHNIDNTNGEGYTEFMKRHLDSCSISMTTNTKYITEEKEVQLSIFPNPAGQTLYINADKIQPEYLIYDSMGRIVRRGRGNEVDLSSMHQGVYFIQVEQEVLKFLKS